MTGRHGVVSRLLDRALPSPWIDKLRTTVTRELRWAEHDFARRRLVRTHPLQYLFLEVTRRCNLKCRYCGSACSSEVMKQELSIEQWLRVIEQIARDFAARDIMVAVTGGEPLLKPGIFELCEKLAQLGFRYGMVSNGQLLDAAIAQRLVAAGVGSISLSMDAPPAINDELRGKGSSDGVVAAIGHLKAAGYQGKLEIISTISRPAVESLPQMHQYVASLGVELWRITPVMALGRAAQHPELVPSAADIRTILEFVREQRQQAPVVAPEFCEEGYLGNRFEGVVRPFLCECRAGITIGSVLHDGKIGACPELGPAFVQGDILQERFRHVWETRYQIMRDRSWTRRGPCADCGHYRRCQGGSLHLYASPQASLNRCLYLQAKSVESM